ncbi:MAG: DsbE family thiol:disulfide interchange protein [Maricaulaceae bacterium]
MKRLIPLIPLLVAAFIMAIFAGVLLSGRDAQTLPSTLLNQPAPTFFAPALEGSGLPALQADDFINTAMPITVLNVWASWCTPCIAEHPYITELAHQDGVSLVGLNYKDKPDAALKFLNKLGNPYEKIGTDPYGAVAIDFGVYGVPETYVIDAKGIIKFKVVGPVTPDIIKRDLEPLFQQLRTARP